MKTRARFLHQAKKTTAANRSARNVNHILPDCTFHVLFLKRGGLMNIGTTHKNTRLHFYLDFFYLFPPPSSIVSYTQNRAYGAFFFAPSFSLFPSLVLELFFYPPARSSLYQFFHSQRFRSYDDPLHFLPAFVIVLNRRKRTGCPRFACVRVCFMYFIISSVREREE